MSSPSDLVVTGEVSAGVGGEAEHRALEGIDAGAGDVAGPHVVDTAVVGQDAGPPTTLPSTGFKLESVTEPLTHR